MKSLKAGLLLFLLLTFLPVQSAELLTTFDDPEQSELYYSLLKEYRCLKCQNQNLSDSQASLADDLRREIRLQILDGKTSEDIEEYLVSRYGEFVLYRPRFNAGTLVLWLGPFALLLIGLASVVLMARRRATGREQKLESSLAASPKVADERAARLQRARHLLDD